MDSRFWSRIEDKRGVVLALRRDELHRLEITGKEFRQDVPRIMEALDEGQEPGAVGAGALESLSLARIGQIRVSPDLDDVEFRTGGDGGATVKFSTSGNNAGEIARTVLERTGRPFREEHEEISAAEAVMPPAIIGALAVCLWGILYLTAGQIAAGQSIAIRGRRAWLKRLLSTMAEMLGVDGTLALGAVVLLGIAVWAAMRVARRPHRTIWQAE
jgi:hypothetical protein